MLQHTPTGAGVTLRADNAASGEGGILNLRQAGGDCAACLALAGRCTNPHALWFVLILALMVLPNLAYKVKLRA